MRVKFLFILTICSTLIFFQADVKTIAAKNQEITKATIGKGKPQKISIKYDVNDPEGRCGDPQYDNCMSVATIEYPDETIKLYMGKQMDSRHKLLSGSCRSHALTCAINGIKGTTISTLDLQNYLYDSPPSYNGVLKANNFEQTLKHYGVTGELYLENINIDDGVKRMNEALENGQLVMIFVSGHRCSNLASTHHALLVLGTDSSGKAICMDSVGYCRSNTKTPTELVKDCMSPANIGKNYFRMLIFSWDNGTSGDSEKESPDEKDKKPGSTEDKYDDYDIPINSDDDFTCDTIFKKSDGSDTELKKILNFAFTIMQILAPLMAIVLSIIDFIKNIPSADSQKTKKLSSKTVQRIGVAVIIVFLPYVLELLFSIFGLYDIHNCNIGM